ncbi:MAG: acyltransferase [Sphingobium sp.]|nr:acyltransferase [Sphingobium sp.]MCP5399024.1 acyltransferase [Sphingomonas sp.]
MMKSSSIDALKGALILWVIGGHMAEVLHLEHIAFWIGSGFRMPLMVAVSGYLLNLERVRQAPFGDIGYRYWKRMILPWLVASCVYLLPRGDAVSWMTPLDIVLRPSYHLWYIPVLCLLILSARYARFSPALLVMLSAPLSVGMMIGYGLYHEVIGTGIWAFDSRFLSYPLYFFFGVLMARLEPSMAHRTAGVAVAILGLAGWIYLYESSDLGLQVSARLAMNLGLIALLPVFARLPIRIAPVNAIGRASLFYYLWHPLLIGLLLAQGLDPWTALLLTITLLAAVHRLMADMPVLPTLLGTPPVRRTDTDGKPALAVSAI